MSESQSDLANRRAVYRANVFPDSGLTCRIHFQDAVFVPRVMNLSLTGIAVRFDPQDVASFPEGTEARIELRLRDDAFESVGRVVRVRQGNTAFHFPETAEKLDRNPPRLLVKIVMQLQRQMLTRHDERSAR